MLRSSDVLSFIPDNLHKGSNGNLITAGLEIADPVCGDVPMALEVGAELWIGTFAGDRIAYRALEKGDN